MYEARPEAKSNLMMIFSEALQKESPEARVTYLDEACYGNAEIRERVEALLSAHGEAGNFLGGNASDSGVLGETQQISERPGDRVGRYKLLEQIGEGGFGVVFMAEQEEPVRRRVALKVIKPGMDSRDVIARFEAERQALALMDHPGIARILDAGATTSGRPFFVMELVRGVPITEYCDKAKLDCRRRLELFGAVCRSVQHAHQKGVIHRDLKPSNILVTLHDGAPVSKVIDFGVAKAIHQRLTERTLFTRFAQMVGTPLYMSPEQTEFSGLDVDTRTDIYALGVLLYELLTGVTPFEKERFVQTAYDEIRRIIREEEPPTPSRRVSTLGDALQCVSSQRLVEPRRLTELLRGDLDWITMKALEKDRSRRYETASAFAEDIERYLTNEPVDACPPSRWYRARKFARRNRAALFTSACVMGAVIAVVGSIGWLVGERAARHGETARQARKSLLEAEAAIESLDWQGARVAVTRAEGLLTSRGSDPGVAAGVMELARDLDMVARLRGIQVELAGLHAGSELLQTGADEEHDVERVGSGLADEKYKAAFAQYGLAVEAVEAGEAARRIGARSIALELAEGLELWAGACKALEEEARWRHLLSIVRQVDPHPLRDRVRELWAEGNREQLEELARKARTEEWTLLTVRVIGRVLQEAGAVEEAVAFLERAQRRHPGSYWVNHELGHLLYDLDRDDEALRFRSVLVALRPASYAARIELGAALLTQGLLDQAIAEYKEAVQLDPDDLLAHLLLADALKEAGQYDDAILEYEAALQIDPDSAQTHSDLGNALQKKGLLDEAIKAYQEAVRLEPEEAAFRSNLGNGLLADGQVEAALVAAREATHRDPDSAALCSNLGHVLIEAGRADEAIEVCEKAVELDRRFALAHYNLGKARQATGQLDRAIDAYREAIQLAPDYLPAHFALGSAFQGKGRLDDAIRAYGEALRLNPGYFPAQYNLGNAYLKKRNPEKAIEAYRKASRIDSSFAQAHANLGNALRDKASSHQSRGERELARGLLDQAIEAYRKALELDADIAEAHTHLGLALAERGQPDKGVHACREAIELDPQHACYRHNLGRVLTMKGDDDAAILALEESTRLKPEHGMHYVDLALALQRTRRFEKAIAAYSGALKITPNHPGVCNALAWLLATCSQAELRDPGRAAQLALRAIELAPGNGNSWSTLGAARYRLGNWKGAIAAIEKAIEMRSSAHGFDWFFLAMSHRQMGNDGKARETYEHGVRWMEESRPGDEDLRHLRAEAERLLR